MRLLSCVCFKAALLSAAARGAVGSIHALSAVAAKQGDAVADEVRGAFCRAVVCGSHLGLSREPREWRVGLNFLPIGSTYYASI